MLRLMTSSPHAPGKLRSRWIATETWLLRRLYARHRVRSAPHLATGVHGEREAFFSLRQQGYVVVARRWTTAKLRGDLDLIAWQGSTLCFLEVKTRSRRDAYAAEMAVDDDKQRVLRRLARAYLNRLPPPAREAAVRFDVVSVYLGSSSEAEPEFVLNPGAFGW
jgi:putative endonuclease